MIKAEPMNNTRSTLKKTRNERKRLTGDNRKEHHQTRNLRRNRHEACFTEDAE